jgi:glutamyl-tRNA synthetase
VSARMKEYPSDLIEKLLPTIIDRISFYGEIEHIKDTEFKFFIVTPELVIEKILWKDFPKEDALKHLTEVKTLLEQNEFVSPEMIKESIYPYAEKEGKGNVLWPLRMSLSRQEKSVDPFTTLYCLGKEESMRRLNEVLIALSS